jgi:Tol biopolymer transport system component
VAGRLAYAKRGALIVAEADGSNSRILGGAPARVANPTWAPAGGQIAFVYGPGGSGIGLISADGTGFRSLRPPQAYPPDQEPVPGAIAWSPDGRLIAVRFEDGLVIVPRDGGTPPTSLGGEGLRVVPGVTWVDADHIVVAAARNLPWGGYATDLYILSVSGRSWRLLARVPEGAERPTVSSDGKAIGFVAGRFISGGGIGSIYENDVAHGRLFSMSVDGADLRAITPSVVQNEILNGAGWSPDGASLVYASQCQVSPCEGDLPGVDVIRADGSGLRRLVASPVGIDSQLVEPTWSPDGGHILFTACAACGSADQKVTGYQTDASGTRTITVADDIDGPPSWESLPSR